MKRMRPYGPACLRVALTMLLVFAGIVGPARAQGPDRGNRLYRQIGVMEKIMDKLLLDSPNFLVGVGSNAHGLYLPEYGAVFTFEASLTGEKEAFSEYVKHLQKQFEVQTGKDGEQTIVIKPGKDKDDKATKEMLSKLGETDDHSAQTYKAGKEELVQMLLDYGDTLSELKDSQWIVIGAFMGNNQFLKESRISHMIMRAKMEDLRTYSAGKLSEDQMRSRIQTEEY